MTFPNPCLCGAEAWRDFSDSQTGTAYVECHQCKRCYRASARGWVDWRVGLFVDDGTRPGSTWTQRTDTRWSGITHD